MKTTRLIIIPILFLLSGVVLRAQKAGPSPTMSGGDMVLIPGGEFNMGDPSGRYPEFSPAHLVKIDSLYMDRCEVSNAEYSRFCRETGHRLPEFWNTDIFRCGEHFPDHPVVGVSWSDAMKFATWAGKRLPTEAEWEYAARGGLKGKPYPNGNKWTRPKPQQDEGDWTNLTSPVKSFDPNGYDLYNMGGNVWEWVADHYSEEYYALSPVDNPTGPEKGSNRVIRGGSWHSGAMCKSVFFRKGLVSNWCDYATGFRCVKDIQ